jgi:hypothetical protein
MSRFIGHALFLALGMVALALAGCGSSDKTGVVIKGKLLMNGKPATVDITGKSLPPGESARMRVAFFPVKSDTDAIANKDGDILVEGEKLATVDADGTFWLDKVQPQKYRIVITHMDPFTSKDLLKGAFNEVNSKITRDVSPDQEVIIDLAKPKG